MIDVVDCVFLRTRASDYRTFFMDQGGEYKFCWRTEKERIGCTEDETMETMNL